MTDDRQLSAILERWLTEGPAEMPDRVADAVASRITRQPQRPAWWSRRRARPRWVNIRVAAIATAALLVAAILGLAVIGRPPSVVPPPVQPSAEPTTTTSPTATSPRSIGPEPSPAIGPGLIVFEHNWPLGIGPYTRLEYLLPDLRGAELLPDFPGEQLMPAWSHDGARLAFSSFDAAIDGSRELIWETDAAGSAPRSLSAGCDPPECLEERDPAYAADGRRLVLVRMIGPAGQPPTSTVIAIRDVETGVVTELASTRRPVTGAGSEFVDLRHPRWSPDGTRITFHVLVRSADDRPVDSDVFVVNDDGSGLRQLSPDDIAAGDAEWSPDGSLVAFTSKPIHEWPCCNFFDRHLYTIAPDGSGFRQLDSDGWSGAPSWTADGAEILFTFGSDRNGIGVQQFKVMGRDGSDVRRVAGFVDCCRWYAVQQPTP